jgi:multisubunit Na+/H+ antiporter MnhE subunit
MSRFILRTVTLTAVYLLVLTSARAGDVLVGLALSAVIAWAWTRVSPAVPGGSRIAGRLVAAPALALGALADLVRGTWRVALFVLDRRRRASPGLVAIPKGERTPSGVAVWGYLTALAPDELVVDVDEERGLLLVHVLDARDPHAIRARHEDTYERRQRRVFP